MDPLNVSKRKADLPVQSPLKRGRTTPPSFTQKIDAFVQKLEEGRRIFAPILRELKAHFHVQLIYDTRETIQKLIKISSSRRLNIAPFAYHFLHKDDHYIFSRLPRDIRGKIFGYLNKEDYGNAREMVRGDLVQFEIDWINYAKIPLAISTSCEKNFFEERGKELFYLKYTGKTEDQLNKLCKCAPNIIQFTCYNYLVSNEIKTLDPKKLKSLSFSNLRNNNFYPLSNFTLLEKLKIKNFGDSRLDFLPALQSLTTLQIRELYRFSLNPPAYTHYFGKLTRLKELKLCGGTYTRNQDWQELSTLTGLTTLELNSFALQAEHVKFISCLSRLQRINLSQNQLYNLTNDSFASCSNIKSLHLADTSISDPEAVQIARLVQLEDLNVSTNHIKRVGLEAFSQLTRLICLNVGSNRIEVFNLELTRLCELDVTRCDLGKEWISSLDALKGLTRLEAKDSGSPTNSHLKHFKKLTRLRVLNLDNCAIGNNVKYLTSLPQLTHLNLNCNEITVLGSKLIGKMVRLKELRLDFNSEVEPCLFTSLTNLTLLNLLDSGPRDCRYKVLKSLGIHGSNH